MATLLAVEDDADNMALICAAMKKAGHHMLTAADGPSALEAVAGGAPDVILLDVSLVGPITGLDVCRTVRADPALAHIPGDHALRLGVRLRHQRRPGRRSRRLPR